MILITVNNMTLYYVLFSRLSILFYTTGLLAIFLISYHNHVSSCKQCSNDDYFEGHRLSTRFVDLVFGDTSDSGTILCQMEFSSSDFPTKEVLDHQATSIIHSSSIIFHCLTETSSVTRGSHARCSLVREIQLHVITATCLTSTSITVLAARSSDFTLLTAA